MPRGEMPVPMVNPHARRGFAHARREWGRPVAGLTTACKLEPFRDPSRESPESLPEPTQSSAKACLRRAQPPPPLRRTPLRTLPHRRSLTQRIASRLVLASPRTTCPKASSTRFIPTCSQPYTHLSPVPPQKVKPNSSLTQPSQARTTIPWALDRCVRSFAPEPRRRWSPTAPG